MSEQTEAEAIADLTRREADKGTVLSSGDVISIIVPDGFSREEVDTEYLLDQPVRKRGCVDLYTSQSVIDFVRRHKSEQTTTIYASKITHRFVAVINDARGTDSYHENPAEWADHRATLDLIKTPEWKFWTAHDGDFMDQEAFATHIEDGQLEVRDPDAATLLELASTFQAHTAVKFRSAVVLQSGQRQLNYEENTEAGAGRDGKMVIPKEIVLGLSPFEGSALYELHARLRYRIGNGKLSIGYQLIRPHDVLNDAFSDEAVRIAAGTECPLFEGTPPEGVGR